MASATYAYDAAGNMIRRTENGVTRQLSYNAANQLTTEMAGPIETTHGYDELGRLVSSNTSTSTTSYTWDARGQLAAIASAEMTATYDYGVEGMRQLKTVETSAGTTWTKSVWDGQRLVAESYSDGSRADFLYGPEGLPLELVYTAAGGAKTIYAYQLDVGGSVIGLTTAAGTEVASYAYDPWGRHIAVSTEASHPAAARNPLRYRGYYWDDESGLYYLPARYYDSARVRFVSPDPARLSVGEPEALNRYCYGLSDPVNMLDEDGREPHGYNMADGYGPTGYNYGMDPQRPTVAEVTAYAEAVVAAKNAWFGVAGSVRRFWRRGQESVSPALGQKVAGFATDSATLASYATACLKGALGVASTPLSYVQVPYTAVRVDGAHERWKSKGALYDTYNALYLGDDEMADLLIQGMWDVGDSNAPDMGDHGALRSSVSRLGGVAYLSECLLANPDYDEEYTGRYIFTIGGNGEQ